MEFSSQVGNIFLVLIMRSRCTMRDTLCRAQTTPLFIDIRNPGPAMHVLHPAELIKHPCLGLRLRHAEVPNGAELHKSVGTHAAQAGGVRKGLIDSPLHRQSRPGSL